MCVHVCGGQGRGQGCVAVYGSGRGSSGALTLITHGPAERGEIRPRVYTGVLGRGAGGQAPLGVTYSITDVTAER